MPKGKRASKPAEKIPKIVITGGPCSGKSLGLDMLVKRLPEIGVKPILLKEVPSAIFESGVTVGDMAANPKRWADFQKVILGEQMALEKSRLRLARLHPAALKVLLCDRGALDGMAYVDPSIFQRIARASGFANLHHLRDRYDAVIHLVTAALGAPEHYNLDNNPYRTETPEQATARDRRTLAAWNGHENLHIIANQENGTRINFSQKLDLLFNTVCHSLDLPVPIEIERKYLVSLDAQAPVGSVAFDIKQSYLTSSDPRLEPRLRRKTAVEENAGQESSFFHSVKSYPEKSGEGDDSVRGETNDAISEAAYLELLKSRDRLSEEIVKRRFSFAWGDQYFHLDFFSYPLPLVILEVNLTDRAQTPNLPPFVHVLKEVTSDRRYFNKGIASGLCPGYVT